MVASTGLGPTPNADAVGEFLIAHGLSNAQVAGILGNMEVESGNGTTTGDINPNAYSIDTNGLPSGGIVQWNGPRLTAEESWIKTQGGSGLGSVQQQTQYLWNELNSAPYSSTVLPGLKAATTPTAAATIWDQKYEVSSPASLPQRVANAVKLYAGWTGAGSGTGLGGTTNVLTGGAVSGAAGAISDTTSALGDIGSFLGWFGNTQNLLRMGYVVLGGVLVLVGAGKLIGVSAPTGALGVVGKMV